MDFEVDDAEELHAALDSFCAFLKELNIAEESIFDSRLVISELAGNVLRHAKERARVQGEIVDGKIEVEVSSSSRFCPPETPSLPDPCSECGRGLYLVDKISKRCFFTPDGGIRVVIRTVFNPTEEN